MKKFVLTSNKYSFCLDGFQKLINKYWDLEDSTFTILGFQNPNCEIGKNFFFQSLGENLSDASDWDSALNPFFSTLEDEYFFLCFEDHFLIEPIRSEYFERANKIMSEDPTISKIRVHPKYLGHNLDRYDDLFSFAKTGPETYYTTSLRPAIWRKDFFLQLLNHPAGIKNPHDFEGRNNQIGFDAKVLIPNELFYADLDAMRRGEPNPQTFSSGLIDMDYYNIIMRPEDLLIFQGLGEKWKNR